LNETHEKALEQGGNNYRKLFLFPFRVFRGLMPFSLPFANTPQLFKKRVVLW